MKNEEKLIKTKSLGASRCNILIGLMVYIPLVFTFLIPCSLAINTGIKGEIGINLIPSKSEITNCTCSITNNTYYINTSETDPVCIASFLERNATSNLNMSNKNISGIDKMYNSSGQEFTLTDLNFSSANNTGAQYNFTNNFNGTKNIYCNSFSTTNSITQTAPASGYKMFGFSVRDALTNNRDIGGIFFPTFNGVQSGNAVIAVNGTASPRWEYDIGHPQGIQNIYGSAPSINIYAKDKVNSGLAYNFVTMNATNNVNSSFLGAIGIYTLLSQGDTPVSLYWYLDARTGASWDNATLKVDSGSNRDMGRVGIGLTGNNRPNELLEVNGTGIITTLNTTKIDFKSSSIAWNDSAGYRTLDVKFGNNSFNVGSSIGNKNINLGLRGNDTTNIHQLSVINETIIGNSTDYIKINSTSIIFTTKNLYISSIIGARTIRLPWDVIDSLSIQNDQYQCGPGESVTSFTCNLPISTGVMNYMCIDENYNFYQRADPCDTPPAKSGERTYDERITILENNVTQLFTENKEIKNELCNFNKSFKWCK